MLPVTRVAFAVKAGDDYDPGVLDDVEDAIGKTLYPRSSPVLENNGITEGEFRDDFHADFNGLSKPL